MAKQKLFQFEYIEKGKLMKVITENTGEFLKNLLLKYGKKPPQDFVVFPEEPCKPKDDIEHLLEKPTFVRHFNPSLLKGRVYWKPSLGEYKDFVNRLQRN